MNPAQIEYAQKVARQLVQLGYADRETARGHFRDYLLYQNLGFQGSFPEILHARKVIDGRGLALINQAVPGPTSPALQEAEEVGMTSMVIKLPPGGLRPDTVLPPAGSGAYPAPARPPSGPHAVPARPPSGPHAVPARPPSGRYPVPNRPPPQPGSARWPQPNLPPAQLHDSARFAQPETTLPLPEFDAPSSAASRSLLPGGAERSVEDLLAFKFPTAKPKAKPKPKPKPRPPETPDEDSRPDGTVILPGDAVNPQRKSGPVVPGASASHQPGEYNPIDGDPEWAVQSTPSFDSGSHLSDTGDAFWKSESGEEDRSPFLEPKVGGFMGEFELLEILGQGGMGVVFKVRHQGTNAIYALKVLRVRRGARTETRRKRFRTEVQAMQRLKHPNVVSVHGYGRDGPFDWYVMDYIEGKDLSTLLKANALSPPQQLDVYRQLCEAIVHAHGRNVVHRDLKPQNVLVDPDMGIFILDFGLAKILDDDEGMTHTGSALGTPFYMSPEQISNPRSVGPPADVFALGVILYELTTGQRPFTGHSAGEVGNKILTVDPPKPSKLNSKLHPNIDTLVFKALEKTPERRYKSAEELLKDLTLHLAGKKLGGESEFVAKARRWFERNRSGFMGGLGVAILLIVFLVLIYFIGWLMVD
jgi:tRNA A-37 threonylcarbamoyl transferase component Bud32